MFAMLVVFVRARLRSLLAIPGICRTESHLSQSYHDRVESGVLRLILG